MSALLLLVTGLSVVGVWGATLAARSARLDAARPAGSLWAGVAALPHSGWEGRWLPRTESARGVLGGLLTNGQHVTSAHVRIWPDRIEWEAAGVGRWLGVGGGVVPGGAVVGWEEIRRLSGTRQLGAVVCALSDGTSLTLLHHDTGAITHALAASRDHLRALGHHRERQPRDGRG